MEANNTPSPEQKPTAPAGLDRWLTSLLRRLNKHLRLKIKSKLGIAFVGFSALPMLVVGLLLWSLISQSLRDAAEKELVFLTRLISTRLEEFTIMVQSDLNWFANILDRGAETPANASSQSTLHGMLNTEILGLLEIKPQYYRLTYMVDSLQAELFSYQRDLTDRTRIHPGILAYSWRYFQVLVQNLRSDQMRLTPVEHRVPETGQTLAVFSLAAPQRLHSGDLVGIFIAEVFADQVFDLIESTLQNYEHYVAGVVDGDGHFVYHSLKKLDWNRLLAEASVNTLDKEYAPAVTRAILSESAGIAATQKGDVIFHTPLALGSLGLRKDYYLYLVAPEKILFAPLRMFGTLFVSIMVVFILLALYLSRLSTLQFVLPIRELQEGSDIIARGNFSHRLHITSGDEIEELARKFNYMADSIEERDRQLQEFNTVLEKRVLDRTSQLQDEKDKLRIVLDNVPSAFVLLDSRRRILTASSALKQLTGIAPDHAIGRQCSEVLEPISDCAQCELPSVNRKTAIRRRERTVALSDGSPHTYELVTFPVTLTSGEQACLEIVSDITDQKRLQEQILHSEKLASLGEMAAVIAHEIRNALTSANMLLQLIRESGKLNRDEGESLEVVLDSIAHVNQITKDLLSFARPPQMDRIPLDVTTVIQEAVALHRPFLDRHQIQLKPDLDTTCPPVMLDHQLSREVFGNILLNACQAVPETGGEIQIRSQLVSGQEVAGLTFPIPNPSRPYTPRSVASETKPQTVLRVQVRDNGPGIPALDIRKIFDPFFTTKINGTGLGLSMARRVVEAHGGRIEASSGGTGGACITLYFPLETDP